MRAVFAAMAALAWCPGYSSPPSGTTTLPWYEWVALAAAVLMIVWCIV